MKCINSADPNGNPNAKQTEPKKPVNSSGKKKKADEE